MSLHGTTLGLQDRDADGSIDSGRENFERSIDGILRSDEADRFDRCERGARGAGLHIPEDSRLFGGEFTGLVAGFDLDCTDGKLLGLRGSIGSGLAPVRLEGRLDGCEHVISELFCVEVHGWLVLCLVRAADCSAEFFVKLQLH